jgi:tRNA threonylcarbamoyl adenosine modification protein (Sua5/YciO/YrdC/YwlC family)
MILPIDPAHPEPRKIRRAVEVLRGGGVIAYPTGTVYGLGCSLFNKKAIEKVYRIKGADPDKKPFSFLCPDLSHISHYATVGNGAYRIIKRLVPGPYTFVLEATKEVPRLVQTKRKEVGIRVPDHPVALALLEALGEPIISTSAGKSEPLTDPAEIKEQFHGLDLILDAGTGGVQPSTILNIDPEGNVIVLREGAGPLDNIF